MRRAHAAEAAQPPPRQGDGVASMVWQMKQTLARVEPQTLREKIDAVKTMVLLEPSYLRDAGLLDELAELQMESGEVCDESLPEELDRLHAHGWARARQLLSTGALGAIVALGKTSAADPAGSPPPAAAPSADPAAPEEAPVEFEEGTTAEIAQMLSHAFEGFHLPPPSATVAVRAASAVSVRLRLSFAPDLAAINGPRGGAEGEEGLEEEELMMMMAGGGGGGEGDGDDGGDFAQSALLALVQQLAALPDADGGATAGGVQAAGAEADDDVGAVVEVPASEVDAAGGRDGGLYGLLSTLRDQLRATDYLETHPGDPSLLPMGGGGGEEEEEEEGEGGVTVMQGLPAGELGSLIGSLQSQLRQFGRDDAAVAAAIDAATASSEAAASGAPDDWEASELAVSGPVPPGRPAKRTYTKEGLLGHRDANAACPDFLRGRYDHPVTVELPSQPSQQPSQQPHAAGAAGAASARKDGGAAARGKDAPPAEAASAGSARNPNRGFVAGPALPPPQPKPPSSQQQQQQQQQQASRAAEDSAWRHAPAAEPSRRTKPPGKPTPLGGLPPPPAPPSRASFPGGLPAGLPPPPQPPMPASLPPPSKPPASIAAAPVPPPSAPAAFDSASASQHLLGMLGVRSTAATVGVAAAASVAPPPVLPPPTAAARPPTGAPPSMHAARTPPSMPPPPAPPANWSSAPPSNASANLMAMLGVTPGGGGGGGGAAPPPNRSAPPSRQPQRQPPPQPPPQPSPQPQSQPQAQQPAKQSRRRDVRQAVPLGIASRPQPAAAPVTNASAPAAPAVNAAASQHLLSMLGVPSPSKAPPPKAAPPPRQPPAAAEQTLAPPSAVALPRASRLAIWNQPAQAAAPNLAPASRAPGGAGGEDEIDWAMPSGPAGGGGGGDDFLAMLAQQTASFQAQHQHDPWSGM